MKTTLSGICIKTGRLIVIVSVATAVLFATSRHCTAGLFGEKSKVRQGESAAPFVTKDLNGNRIDLSEHIGQKAILLDFWSIYCSPCVREMPAVIDLYEKYNAMGLEVFGISLDSSFNARRLGKFIEGYERNIPYPIIHDARSEIRRLYGVDTLPTYVLVDTDGVIHLLFVGASKAELETAVRKILGPVK